MRRRAPQRQGVAGEKHHQAKEGRQRGNATPTKKQSTRQHQPRGQNNTTPKKEKKAKPPKAAPPTKGVVEGRGKGRREGWGEKKREGGGEREGRGNAATRLFRICLRVARATKKNHPTRRRSTNAAIPLKNNKTQKRRQTHRRSQNTPHQTPKKHDPLRETLQQERPETAPPLSAKFGQELRTKKTTHEKKKMRLLRSRTRKTLSFSLSILKSVLTCQFRNTFL